MKDSKREFEEKLLKLCVKALILGREEVVVDLPSLITLFDSEIAKAKEGLEKKVQEFDSRLDYYNDHTQREHTVAEQLIVQNIQSDFINMFESELDKLNSKQNG